MKNLIGGTERKNIPVTFTEEVVFSVYRNQTIFESDLPLVLDPLDLKELRSQSLLFDRDVEREKLTFS